MRVVSQNFASWNRVVSWLRRLVGIRAVAKPRMMAGPISRRLEPESRSVHGGASLNG
jgi:hypothetical protein